MYLVYWKQCNGILLNFSYTEYYVFQPRFFGIVGWPDLNVNQAEDSDRFGHQAEESAENFAGKLGIPGDHHGPARTGVQVQWQRLHWLYQPQSASCMGPWRLPQIGYDVQEPVGRIGHVQWDHGLLGGQTELRWYDLHHRQKYQLLEYTKWKLRNKKLSYKK